MVRTWMGAIVAGMLCLLANFCQSARAESSAITFGIEQELRHPSQWLSVLPWMIPGVSLLRLPFSLLKAADVATDLQRRQLLLEYRRAAALRPDVIRVDGDHVYLRKAAFGFKVTADFTVLEMPTDPFTLEGLKAARESIHEYMFELPRRIGLRPDPKFRAGHVHIGLTAFEGDPLKFLNFVIDFVNHSELSSGILLYDPVNAAPALQTKTDREAFKAVLADFDAGKLRTIDEIRDRLLPLGFAKVQGKVQPALNLKPRVPTIEVRSNASFDSVDQMIDLIELLQNRVAHLNGKKERLPYLDTGPILSQQQLVDQFFLYVVESGSDWNRFRGLMPPGLRRSGFTPHPEDAFPHNPRDAGFGYKCRRLLARMRSLN